jgi:glycosyltransferase involved in cell wall biosynthesis
VIPSYNAGRYIGRAIDSVLAQTVAADEIIVVDDGSTDNTADVVTAYGSTIKYIRQDNAGASVARNTGIEAATSEWIAFLDADDEFLPDKLRLQIEHLRRNPDLVWTAGNFICCACRRDHRAVRVSPEKLKEMLGGKEYWDDYFGAVADGHEAWTGTMLIRRDVLFEAGLFRRGQLRANDYDTWFRIAYLYPKIGYLVEPTAVYHLDVEGSIIRKYGDSAISCELIGRHLKLSEEFGKADEFRPCAVHLLRRWMRGMLFEARGGEVRRMTDQFAHLLPGWYAMSMRLFAAFPKSTALGCRTISWVARTLGLRKRIVRSRG